MKLDWHPKAVDEFLELENKAQKYLNKEIEKLPQKGIEWDKVSRIKREKIGIDAYRLKLNPENRKEIDHRIILDVKKNSYFLIAKVGRRPDFYDLENLEEAEKRL